MRKITAYQTADGHIHTCADKAKSHAANMHGLALSNLAHRMVRETGARYSPSGEWLMENRQLIETMYKLHDDMKVVADDEEA